MRSSSGANSQRAVRVRSTTMNGMIACEAIAKASESTAAAMKATRSNRRRISRQFTIGYVAAKYGERQRRKRIAAYYAGCDGRRKNFEAQGQLPEHGSKNQCGGAGIDRACEPAARRARAPPRPATEMRMRCRQRRSPAWAANWILPRPATRRRRQCPARRGPAPENMLPD